MTRPLILRPEADAEVRKTYFDLEQIRPGLGGRFASQLKVVLDRIESSPEVFGIVWLDVRAARLKKLRYVVYYVVFDDRIEVLAVMHGAREPAIWQSRSRHD